jgi:very-long-chain (3R)-3-hydroxyacyl-CoA dehydratase
MNNSLVYLALLFAWSIADTIRYVYLAVNLWDKAPKALVWLRYVYLFIGKRKISKSIR